MAKKAMRNKIQEPASDCDNSLSKLPEATADQLNLAKLLAKPDDIDLSSFVAKLRELTECTEDQAVTALYDSENKLERAVELLLDKFRLAGEEWHTLKRKQKTKQPTKQEQLDSTDTVLGNKSKEDHGKSLQSKTELNDRSRNSTVHGNRDNKRPSRLGARMSGSEDSTNADSEKSESVHQPDVREHRLKAVPMRNAYGWDPYTEYGGWGGESIEVINSNASIAKLSQQKDVLHDELFVESDGNKSFSEQTTEDGQSSGKPSPSTINVDSDSIFVSKALSKPPPRAFTNLHLGEVFVVPDLSAISWDLKFGGELFNDYVPEKLKSSVGMSMQADCNASVPSTDNPVYSVSPSNSPNYVPIKLGTPKNLLDTSTQADFKTEDVTKYPADRLLEANIHPKAANTFAHTQKTQRHTSFDTGNISGQTGYLDPSLKSYILDNLPDELNKISVNEPPLQYSKASQFNFSQSQSVTTGLPQTQPVNVSLQQQTGKASHLTGGSQQTHQSSVGSGPSQIQQSTGLPPGMPHFIGQFTPPPYMFNLPGASGNAPAFLDVDQLQLFQHHQKMFFDMQLQQHAATTAQSLLSSNTDTPATSKSMSQNIPSSLSHITATNSAIRPEMLASAMGHASQVLPPGNPYFSYPGFVLMNGYPNAFLNQHQQSNADGPTTLGASMNQASSTGSQSYGGLKPNLCDLFDVKYPDPSKQVGFKNSTTNPNSFNFQDPSSGGEVSKVSNQASSLLNQSGFNANAAANSGCQPQQQPYAPQYYASTVANAAAASPYLTAAVAAAVAASAQQQQAASAGGNIMSDHAPTTNKPNSGGNSQLQMSAAQAMGLHHPHHPHAAHQRSVMHHHPH